MKKYSDLMAEWLVELGYTHCFFVAGGHAMHLLESCSRRLTCIAVVHEVAAGIAAEYFNEVDLGGRAFALVTSGPGLTNILTAMAGAFLESRELLVIGGQVKSADLARGQVRQRGIQEIDGVALTSSLTRRSERIDTPIDQAAFVRLVSAGSQGRRAPVFLEVPLDVQGAQVEEAVLERGAKDAVRVEAGLDCVVECNADLIAPELLAKIVTKLAQAERPVLLLGAGIRREVVRALLPQLTALGVPVMLTWNAIDRVAADHPLNFGRPNTWGQRYANILLQQADLLLALGTRLSLQQTGFCWQQFVAQGEIIQVDCDPDELRKGHPRLALAVCGDANAVLEFICLEAAVADTSEWMGFCAAVKQRLPVVEAGNQTGEGYLSPYRFVEELSQLAREDDIIIPCSSGSAFTVMMQSFAPKAGQRIVTNKGLASMGYGLSGAIGATVAGKERRTLLVEGDGGFLQNLQELGTVAVNRLHLKMFLFDDQGYASIRMTQKNYFDGRYVGCDVASGLGLPCWEKLFAAYDIPVQKCGPGFHEDAHFLEAFSAEGPAAFLVQVDPEQTYYPKIDSRMSAGGGMESNPLHLMSPPLDESTAAFVMRYLAPVVSA